MNDDDPLDDLEVRLRARRPAEMPTELRTRLHAAFQPTPRAGRRPRRVLAGALALATGAVLALTGRFTSLPDADDRTAASSPGPSPTAEHRVPAAAPRWALGESLTMNIYTGVPAGNVPAALRLDGDPASRTGLIPVRSADGKLPLKVDCQF